MFVTRLISGVVLLAVILAAIITGGNVLLLFITAISLIGQYELYKTVKLEKSPLAMIGYCASAGYEILLWFQLSDYIMIYSAVFLITVLALYVMFYPKYVTEQISLVFFGFIYVTVLLSYIYQVRMQASGTYTVWLIFIAAWGSDTCAYCVGMLIGKHKLPSKLSPKKTIEGCAGGVIGAGLLGLLYAAVLKEKLMMDFTNPHILFAVIGCCGSVIAQFGDLAASAIKRNHDIKDYGKLIPGHGGILDRFDSILFTAPVVYLLVVLFI
ncbi:phosphatidate cytidylyltransferase [[Clostridium] polysaccharolyticum]|uniref:Phosphatidate cytidylyltransferase n=1 Tax=[Clostridium] polysaccharolyticum TaxID=29364 RepID=A0A1I0B3S6_9FIRM|nr:phosphatidate cytidylyltransferase [[Clostridium] polysaccharolyticum]SET01412.1 phosphatidate cytidylyltransferase [[Clostridium] polysaccharolyticum]